MKKGRLKTRSITILHSTFDKASAVYQGKNIENIESSLSGVVLYDEKNPADSTH